MTKIHQDKALLFHSLHGGGQVLVLANAWDVASARVVEQAGATAVATTSAGVAWSLGAPDGDELARDRAIELIARVAAAVDVPVTADIESGFADTADGVGETIEGVLAAGAVGVNLEDAWHGGTAPVRPTEDQAERIAAARAAADRADIPLFVNARIDIYLRGVGDPATRVAATVARAEAYLAAGANGVFVPGVVDPATVAELVKAIDAPLNVLSGFGAPTVGEFAALGVARVSLGSALAQSAYGLVQRSVRELLTTGTYAALAESMDYGTLNSLLQK
ncbi:isocitrate lyase/phosphoenolpyruvate mutase family protein [Solihabitans fulvus]|uniref:Isocitrate lyase/phosphoenolpyruvate mutase family protein n=1 Tax=Solihabitans fulvus TaxID=1892852 RepID=A0A5B2W9Z0_9PSEU|nr:isocitrate lyase/phosphoenolpyruvate mutase family protein [Solihabitans fulvus]KAA2247678.1 isocitrate lyase/phosphoenolpyruvate mutase family protein [Solihabitans fulvus]